MKLHIYIFRHGQSYFNRDGIFTGWKDSKLTPLGKKQAKKIAIKLKNKKFQIAFQTRLSRSKDTLNFVLKYHPECRKIVTDDRMIERSYGNLSGKYHKTIIKKYGKEKYDMWHRGYDKKIPNGESIKMVEKRVKKFIEYLLKTMRKEKVNVAISAHGNSMRPFRKYFEKLSTKKMMKMENPYDDYFDYTINA